MEYNEAETMKMRIGRFVSLLILKGRIGDVEKAATDKATRANLYKEFGIF